MPRRIACVAGAFAGALVAGTGLAQVATGTAPDRPEFPIYRPDTPVLTLDQDRLFAESAFGRRVERELEDASAELAAENRRIEGELTSEERALTEQRASLSPEEFRQLADAFDEKVVRLRREQDAKGRALQRRDEAERQAFLQAALPVLAELVYASGAVAILDERAVLFSAQAIDVTDRAIEQIDAVIGDGAGPSDGTEDAVRP
ncbi:MAG: OmpH family outer membrane protein [Pseudomonadota bacterium]